MPNTPLRYPSHTLYPCNVQAPTPPPPPTPCNLCNPRPHSVCQESLSEEQFAALLRRLADELEVRGVTAGPVTRILEARVPIIK